MKFTVNTKPLNNALNIAIVDSNVSKYMQKSSLVQLTMSAGSLRINTEANSIITEVAVLGNGDGDASILIDALLFKKLISTITATQLSIEFVQNGIIVSTGSGSYNLPKVLDASDGSLNRPISIDQSDIESGQDVNKDDWKFIKSYQMFALSESTTFPVYTYLFVGENGDIISGDLEKMLFTHSTCSVMNENCLIGDSIVNLFNSAPDGSILLHKGDFYVIHAKTDAFEYVSAFTPRYESEELGKYNSDQFIQLMSTFDKKHITVQVNDINNVLNQVQLLSKTAKMIKIEVNSDSMTISNSNLKSKIASEVVQDESYSLNMNPILFKTVISHCPDAKLDIYPVITDDTVVGLLMISGKLSVALAGAKAD